MPGVTVLPPSSAFPGFGPFASKMQNGFPSPHRETVAEIKSAAKEQAQRVRGASASSLLRTAGDQISRARLLEGEGDLRGALSSLTKAASLVQMFMDSSELKQPGTKSILTRDLINFQQNEGRELANRMHSIEAKLTEIDSTLSHDAEVEIPESPVPKTGGSIAERMRALQNAGLSVSPTKSTSKRMSREIPSTMSPISPDIPIQRPNRISLQGLSSPIPPSSSLTSPLTTASSTAPSTEPSPHTLIPASSFGPPSPSSSASSSPRLSHFSLSDFTQAFPSIDELDEMDGLRLPSVPTGTGSTGSRSSRHSTSEGADNRAQHSPAPLYAPKAFPVLPRDPGPRPSSTPIPPTIDTFVSRPASPAGRSPLSPTVPRKPSGLSLNHQASRSPLIASVNITPNSEKRELPFTTLFPKTLLEFKKKPHKVLVLDVRTRDEFDREHIQADAVVCIEPSVLLRQNVTADSIEDSLAVGPRHDATLFQNRDKFDLVAIYDESSEAINSSPAISSLMKAIYERSFRKILRNMPMILVGGLKAWKAEFGDEHLVRHGSETTIETPTSSPNLANGIGPSSVQTLAGISAVNRLVSVGTSNLNGVVSPIASRASVPVLIGHARAPAESSTSALFSPVLSSSSDGVATTTTTLPMGRSRSGTEPSPPEVSGYRMWIPPSIPNQSDHSPSFSARPSPANGDAKENAPVPTPTLDPTKRGLVRKPAISRPASNSISYSPSIPENTTAHRVSPSLANGSTIQYPQFSRNISPQISGSSFSPSPRSNVLVSLPPQASINPSPLSRRRSDYVDQSQEALSGINTRPSIDYPDLSAQHIIRPPPAAASSSMERQDHRPRVIQQTHPHTQPPHPSARGHGPKPPTIQSDYPVTYWADIQIGTSGLKNLGNTCYMNSTIQCLSATVPFARFFTDGRWKSAVNMMNPLGTKGNLAHAFASILRDMWQGEMQCLSPVTFRRSICTYASQFSGTEQHDSQEFLSFLLDGLHEDLNRVLRKPVQLPNPDRETELERLPMQLASEQEWQLYRMRDDSLIVDFFQGQFRNRLECMTCHKTSTTYNSFMYLTLPIPTGRSNSKVTLQQCLDAFVKEEVMEKSDAWNCPSCKALRKAKKTLSLSRLPPVLLIHLKRFSVKGPFTDKIETCVDFPLKGLELTNYMPPPLPPGVGGAQHVSLDDPRAQLPPYRYDLYGVTNHFGTLSSGHYTAFIASRGGWLYCDDSRITSTDPKDVVGKPAYILFYKRTKL